MKTASKTHRQSGRNRMTTGSYIRAGLVVAAFVCAIIALLGMHSMSFRESKKGPVHGHELTRENLSASFVRRD